MGNFKCKWCGETEPHGCVSDHDGTLIIQHCLSGFLNDALGPGDRPERGDSSGNEGDCYNDGYEAARYDLARKIENLFVRLGYFGF